MLVVALVLVSGLWNPVAPVARAQGAAPEPGEAVLEDGLTEPGFAGAFTTASGRCKTEFGNEGYTITIAGGCPSPDAFAGVGLNTSYLTFADGEVRVEFRQLSGMDRAQVQIAVRTKTQPAYSAYSAALVPGRATAWIGASIDGQFTTLAQRADLAEKIAADGWNTLALRVQGTNLWLFLNGEQILTATDERLGTGGANVLVSRTGRPDPADTHEVSGVVRNFRVSALADGDRARAPVYAPPVPVTASALPCTQPTAVPNDVTLTAPAVDLDPTLASLAGAWEGVWSADGPAPLPSRLYVEQIDAKKATIVYTWGEGPGQRTGWQRLAVDLQPDGKFGWGTTRRFSFWPTGDDTLEGALETPQFTSKIVMARCPAA